MIESYGESAQQSMSLADTVNVTRSGNSGCIAVGEVAGE
jgi:hypothetical protein